MILLIGCGLAAYTLAHYLDAKQIEFKIIGDLEPGASKISSGIINPISGRNLLLSWQFQNLKQSSLEFYSQFENSIEEITISKHIKDKIILKDIDLFENPEKKYINIKSDSEIEINGAYSVNVNKILDYIEKKLISKEQLISEKFEYQKLKINSEGFEYKNEKFSKIVFAEGAKIINNPFFKFVPYLPSRGEALHVKIPDLKLDNKAIHYHKFLCKFKEDFWIGSSFENVPFSAPTHTPEMYEILKDALNIMLSYNYERLVIEHLGAFRLASHDRKPYVGEHPDIKGMYIFNGFGTKGVQLIPHYAIQLVSNLLFNFTIDKQVGLDRIKKDKKYLSF